MKFRFFLTTALLFTGLGFVGCGGEAPKAEVGKQALTAEDIAKANADMEKAADSERAFQSQNPVGKAAGKAKK